MRPNDPAACNRGWEHFPHGADVGVRGYGASEAEAFAQAALALSAIVTDPLAVQERHAIDVSCEAPDEELLLVDWLNALIYEMVTRKMCFGRFDVRIENGRLEGRAWGEALDVVRHAPNVEPKGATYTALRVAKDSAGRWVAQCVVDV
jgi:SHS2 domain-containing protein